MMKRMLASLLALVWAVMLTACTGPLTGDVLPSAGTSAAPGTVAPEMQEPAPSVSPIQDDDGPQESSPQTQDGDGAQESQAPSVDEDGWYDSKDEVALYIHLYGHLPDNYVTKREAEDLGWSGGSVERYAGEGTAIGGSRFGNYEGLLPEAEGRTYTECDIDTVGASSRGAKRIVFSNDGLIYYTEDHYESFERLYGEE